MNRTPNLGYYREKSDVPRRDRPAWPEPLVSPGLLNHAGFLNRDRLPRPVQLVYGNFGDLINDVHPAHDLPERRVLRIQAVVVRDVDEELAPAGVRAGVRHRDRSPRVPVVRGELVLDGVAGPAVSGAFGVPALDHEPADDPVEDRPVVELLVDELPEVLRGDRHLRIEQLDR